MRVLESYLTVGRVVLNYTYEMSRPRRGNVYFLEKRGLEVPGLLSVHQQNPGSQVGEDLYYDGKSQWFPGSEKTRFIPLLCGSVP